MTWILWAALLVMQNAAFVANSRARNGRSVWYHALTALASNGIWFVSQFILIDNIVTVLRTGAWWQAIGIGVFYTTFTMTGALLMHYLAIHHIEPRVKGGRPSHGEVS